MKRKQIKKKKTTKSFEKEFVKRMNNVENMRKHRDIQLVRTEKRGNYLVSEPNYHTTIIFLKIYYEN